jgi:hypothetical protein
VYKDPSSPSSNNLQGKINLLSALSTSPSGCQEQGVCKYTKLEMNMQYKINKYPNATTPKNLCCGNMQTKVICNAMINCKRYSCSVLVCEMQ